MSMLTIYQTSDFPTAITLQLLSYELINIDRTDIRRAVFQFSNSAALKEDLERIRKGEIKVDPVDFWHTQKRLKHMLYDGR